MKDFTTIYNDHIAQSIHAKQKILTDESTQHILSDFCHQLTQAFRNGKVLHLCGNGGSAADAQHIAAEFSGRYLLSRKGINAEALHANSSAMTAISNDFGFDNVYARLLEAKGAQGDMLIAISTSGNSPNVLKAAQMAHEIGIDTLALTGANDSKLSNIAKYCIQVPSEFTPTIQECHIMLGHIICHTVEVQLSA